MPLPLSLDYMKTIKFHTLGCKVNQYDTQGIREQFLREGFREMNNGLPADIYVINTCTVTHRADTESLQLIRRAKRKNPRAKIIVTGCLTELDSGRIKQVIPEGLIVKNKDKNRITALLNNKRSPKLTAHNSQLITGFAGRIRAFLKIQDGCNNRCSYCKVPLVRGPSRSRSLDAIIAEAQSLVKNGFKEIVLTGICLGAYGKDLRSRINLVDIISALERIKCLLRIRLSSIEAGDISDALIEKMASSKKLCRHLHIPIQSADNEILKKMNRNYTRRVYAGLIQKIKEKIPGIAITTDVIVGFPGETEENFKNTVKLIKEISPLKTHIFPYSPREGTAAFNFEEKINPAIIRNRILRLKRAAHSCALVYKKQFLNKNMQVLIEGFCREKSGFWQGHTDNYLRVLVKSNRNLKNQLISLKLKKITKDYILVDFP